MRHAHTPETRARMSAIARALWADQAWRAKTVATMRKAAATEHGAVRIAKSVARSNDARRLKLAAVDRTHYDKLRRNLGAPAARAAMGI